MEKLTDEEHQARAMLMGMRYHHGNGEPFYYEQGLDGDIIVSSMIDANTLETLAQPVDQIMDTIADYTKRWDSESRRVAKRYARNTDRWKL